MTQRVEGKVAFVTGAARGQGRAMAVRLAEEGADIIAVDICGEIGTSTYPGATTADLEQTVRLVEATGRGIVARVADVRDEAGLRAAVEEGIERFGRLDVVCANAGISTDVPFTEMSEAQWDEMLDINLKGVWLTCKVAIPHVLAGEDGGSVVITSSGAGLKGYANIAHYTASKHGAVGLMRSMANEFAPHRIRVNTVNPSTVDTPMVHNERIYRLFAPDKDEPTREDFAAVTATMIPLPIPWVEPVDVANAVVFLASDEARYITGVALPVDGGLMQK